MAADDTQERVTEESAMGVPHITSFCWCMGLEVGAKVVGVLHLLSSLAILLVCTLMAGDLKAFAGTSEDQDGLYSTLYKFAVAASVVTVVHCALAITLLLSVFKRSTCGLRVWVATMSVLWVAAIVLIVVSAAWRGFSGSGSDIFLSFLEGLLLFGFLAYCILAVNSYYLMLRSAEDMEGPNKTMY